MYKNIGVGNMKKEYFINELSKEAYENAIENIIVQVEFLTNVYLRADYDIEKIEQFAFNTSMIFDSDGNFIK